MSNGKQMGILKEASKSGKIEQDVTNDMLFAAQMEVWELLTQTIEVMQGNKTEIAVNKTRIDNQKWLNTTIFAIVAGDFFTRVFSIDWPAIFEALK